MNRPDGHLEDAFALDLAELVALALERRQHGLQIEFLSQRMNLRPVVVEGTTARIGMAFEFEPEQVLDFPLLPIGGGQGIGQRDELRPSGDTGTRRMRKPWAASRAKT